MDPINKAIEMARQRGSGNLPDHSGTSGPSMFDANGREGRLPSRKGWGNHVTADTGLDVTGLNPSSLYQHASDEMQTAQADLHLQDHVATTIKSNRIQIENDLEDLERKRRFNGLVFWAGIIFGILFFLAFIVTIGVIVYTSINNGSMEDTSIVSAIVSAIVEMMKMFSGG